MEEIPGSGVVEDDIVCGNIDISSFEEIPNPAPKVSINAPNQNLDETLPDQPWQSRYVKIKLYSCIMENCNLHKFYNIDSGMSAIQSVNPNADVLRHGQALSMMVNAALGLQTVVKSNLGPKGTLKMYHPNLFILGSFPVLGISKPPRMEKFCSLK